MKSITQVVENLIKPYIDSHDRAAEAIIAPVETNATSASDDYAVGKQLILNNVLYDVIAPITEGDALVVNTNIKASDNVSSDIEALTNKLADEVSARAELGAHNLVDINGFTLIKSSARTKYIYPSDIIHGAIPSEQVVISFKVTNSNLSKSDNYFKAYGSGGEIGAVSFKANGRYSFVFDGASFNNFYIFISSNAESDETCTISEIMITLATDAYSEYTPYAKTNQELTAENQTLTNNITDISVEIADMNNVYGAKNFVKSIVNVLNAAGMTYTLNADGSISVQGTSNEQSYCQVCEEFILKKGKYILSGCPDVNGESTKARLYISSLGSISDYGDGVTFTVNSDTAIKVAIRIESGVSFSTPVIFYPMIRLASIQDSTYEPYAKTNQALTNEIDNIKIVEITATSDGVKTFSDLLKELVNNAKSYVSGTDLKLAPYALAIPAVAFMPIAANKQISKSSSSETLVGNGMAWAGGTFLLYYVEFEANAAIFYNCSLGTTPSIAFNNKASDIPATGFKFVLSCIQTN